jgi:hypothetical protein
VVLQHGGHSGEIDLADLFGLASIYSNIRFINKVANATKYEMVLLAHVLDPHSVGIVDPKGYGD